MLKLQKEINYEKSNVERDELINKLSATLDKEDLERMVELSKKVAADKTMQEINELQLYSFMIQHTKDMDGYQNLKKHIGNGLLNLKKWSRMGLVYLNIISLLTFPIFCTMCALSRPSFTYILSGVILFSVIIYYLTRPKEQFK